MSLALGDGYFDPNKKGGKGARALLVIAQFSTFEIVRLTPVFMTVDGSDGTQKTVEAMARAGKGKFFMMDGVVHAGFNYVDPRELFARTRIPVIVFQRRLPDMLAVYSALERHFDDWEDRWKRLSELSNFMKGSPGEFFFAAYGIEPEKAKEIIVRSLVVSDYPEQLRQARVIARASGKFVEDRLEGPVK
ncbi:DUF99 family protein [Tardisphaera miroshnichenkoae]